MSSVTVVVPMAIRRRGGRKQIIGPDGAPVRAGDDAAGGATTRGDPALVKALARAFRWRRMLEERRYGSIRELAAAEGVDRAYVGRVLSLTLLAPDVVEAVLDGRHTTPVALGQIDSKHPDGRDRPGVAAGAKNLQWKSTLPWFPNRLPA
jgi:hypothetical protein